MKNKSEKLASKSVLNDIVDSYFKNAVDKKIVVLYNADPNYIKLISRAMEIKANRLETVVQTIDASEAINLPNNGDMLVIRDPTRRIGCTSKQGWYSVDVGALLNYAQARTSRLSRGESHRPSSARGY
jgi:hypothetical protein